MVYAIYALLQGVLVNVIVNQNNTRPRGKLKITSPTTFSLTSSPVLITLTVGDDNVRELAHHSLGTPVHQTQRPAIVGLEEPVVFSEPACSCK